MLSNALVALTRFGRGAVNHNRALEAMLIGTTASGVLAAIVIARSIGPTGRGTVVALTVWGQILGWLATLSLDKALVVLTSGNHPEATPDEGLRAVRAPILITSCAAIIASVWIGNYLFANVWLTIALAAFAVATAQAELIGARLLAMGRRLAFISWRFLQPAMYVCVMTAVALLLRATSAQERTVAMGIGAAASVVVPVIFVLGSRLLQPAVASRGIRPMLRFAAAAYAATILQYLNGRLDLLVLTFLVSPESLGLYSVGAALGQLVVLTANAGVIRGITGEARTTDFAGIGIAIILAGLVIVGAPLVIPRVFGVAFASAVPIARILAIGGVANYALQAACGRLLGRRLPWTAAFSQGIGVIVFSIGIVAFRTPQGVAWSSVVSFVISLIVAHAALRLTTQG
jgi:O-antigen/teichoic acid export membrane protein